MYLEFILKSAELKLLFCFDELQEQFANIKNSVIKAITLDEWYFKMIQMTFIISTLENAYPFIERAVTSIGYRNYIFVHNHRFAFYSIYFATS